MAGRVSDCTHVAVLIDDAWYALEGTGVRVLEYTVTPVHVYNVGTFDYYEVKSRIYDYVVHGFKVSWWSLLKALFMPFHCHFSLCTSFVCYVITGTVLSEHCNSVVAFENYIKSIEVIPK